MKIYLVGGAVRDKIMGITPKDYDYVVVGSSPDQMLSLGFEQVGADFPVFLHPDTGDEYALARKERKVGVGYTGFETDWKGVSIEEDLLRRDLTINAIAEDIDTGEIIDPYGGINDIHNKILKPVSEAFKEDPIRILRVCRFTARNPEFQPDPIIRKYANLMIDDLLKVSPERVWKEFEKAFSENFPSKFVQRLLMFTGDELLPVMNTMQHTPQRSDHHPEIWCDKHTYMVMDLLTKYKDPRLVFAGFCHDWGKPFCHKTYGNAHGHEKEGLRYIKSFCERFKVPNDYRDLALLVCEYHTKIHGCMGRGTNKAAKAKTIMKLFEETKALSKPDRFEDILKCCMADAQGRGRTPDEKKYYRYKYYPQYEYLMDCLYAVKNFKTCELSKKLLDRGVDGVTIGKEIRAARINLIKEVMKAYGL